MVDRALGIISILYIKDTSNYLVPYFMLFVVVNTYAKIEAIEQLIPMEATCIKYRTGVAPYSLVNLGLQDVKKTA